MKKQRCTSIFIVLCVIALFTIPGGIPVASANPNTIDIVYDHTVFLPLIMRTATTLCRFGITYRPTVLTPPNAERIAQLRVGAFLDWGLNNKNALPGGVEYVHVVAVGGNAEQFSETLISVESSVRANRGDYWIVGNEPDTSYDDQGGNQQDNLLAEVYAERFYQIAKLIRQTDLNAKIGFGSLVQPTPIRLRYLDRAWTYLVARAGSQQTVSALIDFWTTHNFILNEQPGEWGTGVPPGFIYPNDTYDLVKITNMQDTYSYAIFTQRILAYRNWMKNHGQQSKALWITEYGSLLPPIDPSDYNYVNVTDSVTANYMTQTFTYMRTATDSNLGMPSDGNLLVQRWFWYSLSDHRYTFGGSLFDPDNALNPTVVGTAFINYTQSLPIDQSCKP